MKSGIVKHTCSMSADGVAGVPGGKVEGGISKGRFHGWCCE